MPVCSSVSLSAQLSACFFQCLPACLYVCLSICLGFHCLLIYSYVCLSLSSSFCCVLVHGLLIFLLLCWQVCLISLRVCLSIRVNAYLSLCLPICLLVCPSVKESAHLFACKLVLICLLIRPFPLVTLLQKIDIFSRTGETIMFPPFFLLYIFLNRSQEYRCSCVGITIARYFCVEIIRHPPPPHQSRGCN